MLFDEAYKKIISENSNLNIVINEDLKSTKLRNIINTLKQRQYEVNKAEKKEQAKNVIKNFRWKLNIKSPPLSDIPRISDIHNNLISVLYLLEDNPPQTIQEAYDIIFSEDTYEKLGFDSIANKNIVIDIFKNIFNEVKENSTTRGYGGKSSEHWYVDSQFKTIRNFFSQYDVSDISDDQVIIIDDLGKPFTRKIKGKYQVGIACKGDKPLYIVHFAYDGTISSVYPVGNTYSDNKHRWITVQRECDNMVMFSDIEQTSLKAEKKRNDRPREQTFWDYERVQQRGLGGYNTGDHTSRRSHQDILDQFNNITKNNNIRRYENILSTRKNNNNLVEYTQSGVELLTELKYIVIEFNDNLKDKDLFDDDYNLDWATEINDALLLYKNTYKLINNILKVSTERNHVSEYDIRKLEQQIQLVEQKITIIKKYMDM